MTMGCYHGSLQLFFPCFTLDKHTCFYSATNRAHTESIGIGPKLVQILTSFPRQWESSQPRINLLFQPQLLVKQLVRWNSEIFQGNRTVLT